MGSQKSIKPSDSISLELKIDSEVAVSIISNKYVVLWTNNALEKLFPRTKGKTCYQAVKGFDIPCENCPVKKTFENKTVSAAIIPAPGLDSQKRRILRYSNIISFPYTYDKNGDVESAVEILFDHTENYQGYSKVSLNFIDFLDRFSDALIASRKNYIPELLLYAGVAKNGLNFDFAEVLSIETKFDEHIVSKKILLKKADASDIEGAFYEDENITDTNVVSLYTKIISKRKKEIGEFPIPDDELIYEKYPVRVDNNRLGVRLSDDFHDVNGILLLTSETKNRFIISRQISDLVLLTSTLKNIAKIKILKARMQVALTNANKIFDDLGKEGILAQAVPMLFGRVHDITAIHRSIDYSIKSLNTMSESKILFETQKKYIIQSLEQANARIKKILKKIFKPEFNLASLMDIVIDVKEIYEPILREQGITVNIEGLRDAILNVDSQLFTEVFINLVDNSIKAFKSSARKKKKIKICSFDNENNTTIVYEDNAIGIAPYQLPYIFNRFYSTTKGAGIGLYFAKIIVEDIHHGKINVESMWGESARFLITMRKEL
jgi:signal transduction histidine kinase